jgi:hypothetical protein
MEKFNAEIKIIGVNPFIFVPAKVLRAIFKQAGRSRQQEIVRYISFLKTEESIDRNILRAIDFLTGKGRFVGRGKP